MEEKFRILTGNCLDTLKELESGSVDCCITSPPYYALRDYGTAKWIGGDENCPHYRTSKYGKDTSTGHKSMMEKGSAVGDAIFKTKCPYCGAVRVDEQIGLEETPDEYIEKLVNVFREVKRVLRDDGTLWINIGDSYWGSGSRGFDFTDKLTEKSNVQKGSEGTINLENVPKLVGQNGEYKNKDLIGIPWMLAFALRKDGWYLRQDIIWSKTNCMPESVTDRCTKSHEYIFLLSKQQHYYYNADDIKVPCVEGYQERYKYNFYEGEGKNGSGRSNNKTNTTGLKMYSGYANKRDVWVVNNSGGYKDENGSHYATYSKDLIKPCILAGSRVGGVVLDPFSGTGTTGVASIDYGRKYIGCELNEKYSEMSKRRLEDCSNQMNIFDYMNPPEGENE